MWCGWKEDSTRISCTVPGGKSKTFTGLSGGGLVTYTVGDTLDDASTEGDLTEGETRSGYVVTLYSVASAGGISLEVFDGKTNQTEVITSRLEMEFQRSFGDSDQTAVEVDNAGALAGGVVNHDVADLGVAVDGAGP